MSEYTLRPYQEAGVARACEMMDVGLSPLVQSPTGSGKTIMATEIVRRSPKPVLAIAHSDEIYSQTIEKFTRAGLKVGSIDSGTKTSPYLNGSLWSYDVVVAMQRTMWSRLKRGHNMSDYKRMIIDECHHVLARTWMYIVNHYDIPRCGLSATPSRSDGKGLGSLDESGKPIFDDIVVAATYKELIEDGFLTDAPADKIYTWDIDTSEFKTSMGDFQMGGKYGASKKLNTVKRVGDCVAYWLKLAQGRRTLCFASSVDHSLHLVERFIGQGVRAVHVDGETDRETRRKVREDLESGKIDIISNYGIYTEGFDCVEVECIILERPTKLPHLYVQMAGRGLRSADHIGKKDLLLIDPVGCVARMGRPTLDRNWSLAGNRNAASEPEEEGGDQTKECGGCGVQLISIPCGVCGWEPEYPASMGGGKVSEDDWFATGTLVRLSDRIKVELDAVYSNPNRDRYLSLLAQAERRGNKPGWAYYRYMEEVGEEPNEMWHLPDPRKTDPTEFYESCVEFATSRGWKSGWAYFRFKDIYGRPPMPEEKGVYA